MADMADYLSERMRLIGHAFGILKHDKVWRWHDYDHHEGLRVNRYEGDGSEIRWARERNGKAGIAVYNVRPIDLANRKVVEIPTGAPKIIDKLTARGYNYDGAVSVPMTYEGEFGKLRGSKSAFSYGFTQSLEVSLKFTQGGEASQFKSEQEIKFGFEARQDWEHEDEEQETQRRMVSLAPDCPPGYDIQFSLERKSQAMKLKVTGLAQVDHGVQLGKFDGSWKGNKGKGGRLWPRWAKYDSFREELLPVLKGKGGRHLMFAMDFRAKPAPKWLIDRLEKPLEIDFEHTSAEFDGATVLNQYQEVLRGPKGG